MTTFYINIKSEFSFYRSGRPLIEDMPGTVITWTTAEAAERHAALLRPLMPGVEITVEPYRFALGDLPQLRAD